MSEIWALQSWFWINYGNKERERGVAGLLFRFNGLMTWFCWLAA
jgi:hypothetical protein